MNPQRYPHLKFYQRHIFWTVFFGVLALSVIVAIGLYLCLSVGDLRGSQTALKTIATDVALNMPVAAHEKLTDPAQMSSDEYKSIETYFRDVKDGNPLIDDIYTLRPTGTPHEYIFVVSASATADTNGNGAIEAIEEKVVIGEPYNSENYPDLDNGLIEPSVDRAITYDKWGGWLSGYAPIRNERGQAVAILGVDYSADAIGQARNKLANVILAFLAGSIPFLALISFFVSVRLTRPLRMLALGMERLAHGEKDYRLPYNKSKDEAALADLFNSMLNTIEPGQRPKRPEEQIKK